MLELISVASRSASGPGLRARPGLARFWLQVDGDVEQFEGSPPMDERLAAAPAGSSSSNNKGVAKHFVLAIEDDCFGRERDEAKIAQEGALDGIYVKRTNVAANELSAEQTPPPARSAEPLMSR